MVAPRKRTTNGEISKGKAIRITGGMTLSPSNEKSKTAHETPNHAQDQQQGQPVYKKQELSIHSPNPLQSYISIEHIEIT